ncbi:MAG: imelysin family protein [Cocleimonas sp.]|nr:imelysin family protein [Cocleimonas sp.]
MKQLLFTVLMITLSSVLIAADWSSSNLAMVDQFAIPAYQALEKKSAALLKQSDAFCQNPDDQAFESLRSRFHQTMDAWQVAQILRSGPAMESLFFYRLEMWPDRSNAAAKHLRKLIKEANPDHLKAEKFRQSSTAIQGLSAMERILYRKESTSSDFQTKGRANFKCQLVQAISQNVHFIATELLKQWQTDYRALIAKPSKDNKQFDTDKAVTAQFLNDLNTQFQVISTQKFKRPLDGEHFRLTRAESWRSQRSLRNILLNVEALHTLYQAGFASHIKDKTLLTKQQALFEQSLSLGQSLQHPLQVAHDKHQPALQAWMKVIGALQASINSELPTAIDIPLGFNSLDGD